MRGGDNMFFFISTKKNLEMRKKNWKSK